MRFSPIRPVKGSPIVWREMRKGIIGHSKGDVTVFVLLIGAFLISAFLALFAGRGSPKSTMLIYSFMSGLYLVVMIRLALFSAGSLTMEKEARTWPLLLTTPLTDTEIIRGKAIAAFRRNMPLLLLYIGLFCLSCINFSKLSQSDMLVYTLSTLVLGTCNVVGSVFFVIGTGLYFGVRLKTTTAAVATTAGLYFVMKYLLCGMFNPARLLFFRTITHRGQLWVFYALPVTFAVIQAGIGVLFLWRAMRRLRCDVF